jgi:hypothetical protein
VQKAVAVQYESFVATNAEEKLLFYAMVFHKC